MTDINGYLKDMTGKPVGITGNPIYVQITQTAPALPQEFSPEIHYKVVEVPHIEYIVSSPLKPKGMFGRLWWNIGKLFGWC